MTVELPRKLYNALEWFAQYTVYWSSNEFKDKALSMLVAQAINELLEAETDEPRLSAELIKTELRGRLA